ncbi:MAG: Rpn family recombination-promoting nuclease/putative transposase, partial [Lachnospiraceae bacterium]|nr:Rpn family recombination-promoting nuclease/putative transposase [Lachnospiraceae bacterium]
MSRENPILNDYVFKQVFGQEDNNPLLIAFLNAMLDGDIIVKSVKILNSELPRISDISRNILLDVQAKTDDGTYVDVEVQQSYSIDLIERMFVYGSRMVTKYNEKGTDFNTTRCIAIWLLDCNIPAFKMFNNNRVLGEFHFKSLDREELTLPLNMLRIYPIELKKGTSIERFSEIKKMWVEFLKESNNVSKTNEVEELQMAYKKMKRVTG